MQTFVFEARERFKFKSVFMLLFFVCLFLYGMGHFLSTTKIQNYYLTLAIKKINILLFSIMYEKRNFYKKYLERLCWFSSYMVYSLKTRK